MSKTRVFNNLLNQKYVHILTREENAIWFIRESVAPGYFMSERMWNEVPNSPALSTVLATKDIANHPIFDTLEAALASLEEGR